MRHFKPLKLRFAELHTYVGRLKPVISDCPDENYIYTTSLI
jgi:hypothetical protein